QQCRPSDERHAERHNTELIAAAAILRSDSDQLAHSQDEQNQSAGYLKIRDRDPEGGKNYFAEKNKNDRDAKRGENSKKRLTFPIFERSVRAQTHENRHEADRIDRDQDRAEGEKKFLDLGSRVAGCL